MHIFRDYYNNEVKLSFVDHPFSKKPRHVWIISMYHNQWLLTRHKDRGLEFPGGNVEKGENARQAAIREVKEETGGTVNTLIYVGQYFVAGKSDNIIKNVYFAEIEELVEQDTYYETDGPVLLNEMPENIANNDLFSFIMKDNVLPMCLNHIKDKHLE